MNNWDIAKAKRDLYKCPVISVTGTSGKTSTCYFLYTILKSIYKMSRCHPDRNGVKGIEQNIREAVDLKDDYWILEIGISEPGNMEKHLKLVQPNLRIITNVGRAHIDTFRSIRDYQDEKLFYIKNVSNSLLIINNNDHLLQKELGKLRQINNNNDIVTFGYDENNDIQLLNYEMAYDGLSSTSQIKINMDKNKVITIKFLGIGKHYHENACLAIACAIKCNVPVELIEKSINNLELLERRGMIHKIRNLYIYDYTFNFVPGACLKNLEEFKCINTDNKIIILSANLQYYYHSNLPKIEQIYSEEYIQILEKAKAITPYILILNNNIKINKNLINNDYTGMIYDSVNIYKELKKLTQNINKTWYIYFHTINTQYGLSIIKKLS